jgi:glycosyltransferase involved in cell wall biosynthesis
MRLGLYMLAHNEAANIERAIRSVLTQKDIAAPDIHVMVNGSTDGTADVVRMLAGDHATVHLHEIARGDKCNAWNEALYGLKRGYDVHFFMDGDVWLDDAALGQLAAALAAAPKANAAAAVPLCGRSRDAQIAELRKNPGLAGNLYALQGTFVDRLRGMNIHLPVGMVGDDSLAGLLAATDLGPISGWDKARILVVEGAGFHFDALSPLSPADIRQQFKRLRRYSRRRYENQLIGRFLESHVISELPRDVAELHAWGIDNLKLAWRGHVTLFDWLALRDIRRMAATVQPVA